MADEIIIGENFSRDGSDYDANAPTPRWSHLLEVIVEELATDFVLVALGIFYPGEGPHGVSAPERWTDIVNQGREQPPYVTKRDDLVQSIDYDLVYNRDIDDRKNTPYFVQELFGLPRVPIHVFGFALKQIVREN